ncbi:MAG TPA: Wzz/FepE/Etk N-terminal domain-containing protein [Bryobacteraceae bacterium]|nr:Wzz/FepE/Etk N-terminal domain-containing protein [Bryobacteraceae bacterium]
MTATAPGYVTISRRPLDLEDYIDILRRHAGWIIGPMFAGLVIAIVVAFSLPNVYESSAVMQITPSQISEALVQTTVNQQLAERVQQMQSNILSRTSLSNLIQDPRLNLYPEERTKEPMEDVVDAMRRDVKINIASEAATGKKGASVFTITFAYRRRKEAQMTVQALITRFIEESTNTQRTQQNTLKEFFGDELAMAKANLEKRNEDLTKFRKDNQGRLPEESNMNMAALSSLQAQVSNVSEQLNRLANDRVTLEAHLSYLKNQLSLTDLMAQDAPGTNSPTARQNEELQSLNKQIESGELRLEQLLQQYRPTYPDIRDLQSNLKVLKRQRDALQAKQEKELADAATAAKAKQPTKTTNFQVASSQTSIQGDIDRTNALLQNNESDRKHRLEEQDRLTKEIESYRSRLAATSVLEAQYMDLQRDYQSAAEKYERLQHQQDLTAQNAELVSRKATEFLDVLDPPTNPQKPSKPQRGFIVGAGLAVSFIVGLALAGVQEAKDTSLKNLKDVRAYTNLPVLSSIPLLENTLLVKRKRRIMYLAWSAAVIIGLLAIAAALFYYSTVIANT